MRPSDFAESKPIFKLENYFFGTTMASGIFQDRFGQVRRQFSVEISGSIEDGVLILDEKFLYDDGEVDRRIWRIIKKNSQK